jgi:hypothetical protein
MSNCYLLKWRTQLMTDVRELNEEGMRVFREFLLSLRSGARAWPPPDIGENLRYTRLAPGGSTIESRIFGSKLEFGRYIASRLNGRVPAYVLRTSMGLWAWLTLFYLDEVIPADSKGVRKVLSLEKYVASVGHIAKSLEKTLTYFPWKMVTLHRDEADWFLSSPLRADTKIVREFANGYWQNVKTSYIRLVRALYYDEQKGALKVGATTSSKSNPGGVRGLDRYVGQIDLTYDIFGMEPENFIRIMPRRQFRRWLPAAGT